MLDDLYSDTDKYFDYRDDLPKITAKTLVVVGDQDWICPPGAWRSTLGGKVVLRCADKPP